ncbi:hypothetical protein BDY24DRAFT_394736 [Mrakia frigida]|uniref:uncharacterized protein n=1 Tax=Mrakia frigida TaxID=29902 RepID=UPI003FCC1E68
MSSSIQSFGKGALRVAKNYTKGYSDTQTKVREATSNDAWGPSGTQMNEIAQLTYNQSDFVEVMEMLDKRLNDKGKNWRHVFKALTLLDYCLHAGSENVVIYFKDNLYIIKTLKEFVYIDDLDKDVGANVRQKAKDITNLLQDEERLRQERRSRGAMQDRMAGVQRRSGEEDNENVHRRPVEVQRRKPTRNEDDDLQKAIRESLSADDDGSRKRREKEESELAKVLEMSEKEERDRKREEDERIRKLDEQNSRALFDDSLQMQGNNAYQQPDLFAQQTSFNQQQPQPTGGWPLVDTSFGQGSQFNPFYQQQQQQMLEQQQAQAQQQYLQMQYQAQQEQLAREQAAQQQAYLYQQQLEAQQQQQRLVAQPTGYGSNNPFAMGFQPQQQQQPQQQYLPPSPAPQPVSTPIFQNPPPQQAPPSPARQQRPTKSDGENARLAALLANGREDGLDTFGNIGSLRVPGARQNTGVNNPFGRASPAQGQQQQYQQQQSGNLVDF